MAATRAGRKPKRQPEGNGGAALINALKFVSVAQRKTGTPHQTHSVFSNGFVTSFDGMLTVGHPIDEDINACPNTLKLLDALLKCGQQLSITQLDSGRLSIKSEKFKALVPCERFDEMPYVGPDAKCAAIDDRIKTALELVAPLANQDAQRAVFSAVLLQAQTVVATNGIVLLESWHGIDLPPNILLPKASVKAILATAKKLNGFGFSPNSATFYFEDNSYIKTQLFEDAYPAYQSILNVAVNPWPLPDGFFAAVHALASFSESERLFFGEGVMQSHPDANQGATYEVQGLPAGMIYNAEYLQMVEPSFSKVDFQHDKAFFFSEDGLSRGALCGCTRTND